MSGTRLVGTGVWRAAVGYTLIQARTPALTPSRTHLHGISGSVTGWVPFLGLCGFLCCAPYPPRPWRQRLLHRDGECPPAILTAPGWDRQTAGKGLSPERQPSAVARAKGMALEAKSMYPGTLANISELLSSRESWEQPSLGPLCRPEEPTGMRRRVSE